MKKSIKNNLLRALKQSGPFSRLEESQWRSDRLLILCYHGISIEDEHEWRPDSNITVSLFESRLEMLRSGGYTVLPLQDALNKLNSHSLPRKSVVLTFDDGMYNFYACAFPVLQKYNYPVTLYLTTYYCCNNQPVFPLICSYMLWKKRGAMIPANPSLGLNNPLDLTTSSSRLIAWNDIHTYVEKNHFNADQEYALVKGLADHLKLDFDTLLEKRLFHLMTPEEIKEISNKGVDIQLHTHRHRSPLDRQLYQQEIIENQNQILELTGKKAQHFCYPSGVHRTEFLPWLKEMGISSATTCDHGLAKPNTNPLLLPRFLDSSNIASIEFDSWLTGVGSFFPRNPFRKWPQYKVTKAIVKMLS